MTICQASCVPVARPSLDHFPFNTISEVESNPLVPNLLRRPVLPTDDSVEEPLHDHHPSSMMVRPDETESKDGSWSRSQQCRANQFSVGDSRPDGVRFAVPSQLIYWLAPGLPCLSSPRPDHPGPGEGQDLFRTWGAPYLGVRRPSTPNLWASRGWRPDPSQ